VPLKKCPSNQYSKYRGTLGETVTKVAKAEIIEMVRDLHRENATEYINGGNKEKIRAAIMYIVFRGIVPHISEKKAARIWKPGVYNIKMGLGSKIRRLFSRRSDVNGAIPFIISPGGGQKLNSTTHKK